MNPTQFPQVYEQEEDKKNPLISGGAGIFVEDGTMCTNEITLN